MTNGNNDLTPDDFILDEDVEIILLNIFNRTKKLQKAQENQIKIQENQLILQQDQITLLNIITQQLTVSTEHLKLLTQQLKLSTEQQKLILEQQTITAKELQEDADEGDYITKSDTVTNSDFYIIDTDVDPGHPIKAYVIFNDGANSIYVGHNVARSSVGPSPLDANVNNPLNRFNLINNGEHFEYRVNRKTIRNIYLFASTGTSKFRITLAW